MTCKFRRPAALSLVFAAALFVDWTSASAGTKTATSIALAVTFEGSPATSVSAGSVVTLTASVTAGGIPVTVGQVNFCDASAAHCTDIHILGTAQLTSAGTAVFKFRPGIGSHSYKAVFAGTNIDTGSVSGAAALAVAGTIGQLGTTTSVAETGGFGNYTLMATVMESGGTAAPTGTASFVDTSNRNAVLGTAGLGPAVAGINWPNPQGLTLATNSPDAVAVGDFNGDGIPDLAFSAGGPMQRVLIFLGNANGAYTTAPAPPISGYTLRPITVADFNGDGKQDLAILDGDTNTVAVLLGNGDGTFTATTSSSAIGANPNQLAVGDFNGDGIPDLAVTTGSSNSLNILLGNGDGTFTATAASPAAGGSPFGIVTGDFNGDGKLDLAVADLYDDTISIMLGNGDGTFASVPGLNCGVDNSPLAAADFNGDGKLDLAVGASGTAGASDAVAIFLGNGDGTFTSPTPLPTVTSNSIAGVQVGDFNADGIPDLALTDSNAGTFTVFLGNGSGLFTATTSTLPGDAVFGLSSAAGDLNGDGRTDLAVAAFGSGTAMVYLTEPTQTATASTALSIAGVGQHLLNASYAGDSNYTSSASSSIPLWGVTPTTTTTLSLTSGGTQTTSVAPGTVVTLTATVTAGVSPITIGQVNFCDASANSCTDIHLLGSVALTSSGRATFNYVPGPGSHSYRAEYVQSGYGLNSSSAVMQLTVGPAPAPIYSNTTTLTSSGDPGDYSLTATVTGLGGPASPTGTVSFLDTSFGNNSLGSVTLGAGTAGISWLIAQTAAAGNDVLSEVEGDFNRDGLPDLALLWTDANTGVTVVTVYFGKGDGTFTPGPANQTQTTSAIYPPYMISGDFNGDGKLDLALLNFSLDTFSSTVITMLGNGDGTFNVSAPSRVTIPPQNGGDDIEGSMVSADFNGDGKLDLAVAGNYVYGGISILLGNGDGTFTQTASDVDLTASLSLLATGDFNGDGIPDLIAPNTTQDGSAPLVFLGKGDGTFTASLASFTLDYYPASVLVGDFNGDGVLDLACSDSNGVKIALGKGDGTFRETAASPIAVRSELYSLVAGDFNHDGKLDLAGIDKYDDVIVLLLGAGDGTFTVDVTSPVISSVFLGPFAIVSADFNQDGVPDLAMLTDGSDNATVLLTEPSETVSVNVSNIAPVGAGTHNVEASYSGDANYKASVSSTVALTAGLAPVAISPASGTYASVQTVTLSESIPGATIYYYASGTVNTAGFVPYTAPIQLTIGGFEFIQAYATETGYQPSNYTYATYNLNLPPAPTPVFSPTAGNYAGVQSVSITDSAPGATIYYTTNGSLPTASSTQYSSPIAVSTSETIAAIAVASGYSMSAPASAQYIIGSSASSFIYTLAGNGFNGYTGDGGPATLANLNGASSSVMDSAGNLYIADSNNNVIRKVAAGTGAISTIAGTGIAGYSGDNGAATSAQLNYPIGLSLDSAGDLYFADENNDVVRKITALSGVITTVAGTGTPGFGNGDGGPATAAQLFFPAGTAIDPVGNLIIDDSGNDRIRKVSASTGTITTIAGSGEFGYSGDGGAATAASLSSPQGVAVDAAGNIYVADTSNQVVRKVTAGTGIISTVAGSNPGGNFVGGYSGDGGPATAAELYYPEAVTVDALGNLYIADTYNESIRKVTAATGVITTIAGIGDTFSCAALAGDGGLASSAGLCYPPGVSIDAKTGNLYIADSGFSRIRVVTAATLPPTASTAPPVLSVAAGTYSDAQTVTITDATPGASIYLTTDGTPPSTVASGYNGPINVSGNVTIQAIAAAPGHLTSTPASAAYIITSPPATVINTVAGTGVAGLFGSGGLAKSAQIGQISAIAIDSAGNKYLADSTNNVVWEVVAATGNISIVAGNGTPGFSGDGGPATSAQLYFPNGIAVDGSGNIYISDSNNSVVREVVASTGLIKTFAGIYDQIGYLGHIGDGGPAALAYLNNPRGLAFDASGNLYIADFSNNEVRVVSAATGVITSFAGNGNYNFSGEGGPASSAGLGQPNALAFDSVGNLYIASYTKGRVCKVTAATGILTTVAGNGNPYGTSGDGGPATAAEIYPYGLAVDSSENLYISNWAGAVREVAANTGIITKVVGNGYPGYSGDGGSSAVAQIQYPQGIAFDAAGNLYIADSGNYRVREVSTPAPTKLPVAPTLTATPSTTNITTAQALTVAVTVAGPSGGPTPTGSLTLSGGGYTSSSTPLANGRATFSLAPGALATGTDTLIASYTPDAGSSSAYTSASGATPAITVTQAIGTATATVTLTPSATAITNQQAVSVAVSVAEASGQASMIAGPTGTVTLASGSYSAQQSLSSGAATFNIPAGTLGESANTLTASYSGDINYAAASAKTTVTVAAVVVAASSPSPVAPGSSTSATATFSAGSTYSGTMNVTCTLSASPSGAQSLPSCTLNPASITIATGGTASTVVTVNTTAASSSSLLLSPGSQLWKTLSGGGVLALACLFGVPSRRRKARIMAALFGIIVAGMVGCGGGGGSKMTPPPATPATTAGSYTFSVVGTDSANAKITASTNVTVTVQ